MKYIIELEDEPNESYFGEGNFYRCKQIPYWSISESMRNRLEPYDEADRKTEPITHDDYIESGNDYLEARCLNCNNAKACKEKHWEGCIYEPKDEKTCETCRHWKFIAKEFQCETTKCQGYEPKTEPQTERYCTNCKHSGVLSVPKCDECQDMNKHEFIEPQTDTEIAKAIVHKMIDDAVIAEDAYPDLRQKMHDAVDEYEPQTDGYMTAEQAEDYRKMLDKAEHKVYGNIEDEPQTDCSWR